MFLWHLVLGLLIVLPVVIFGIAHIYNAYNRPNRRGSTKRNSLPDLSLAMA